MKKLLLAGIILPLLLLSWLYSGSKLSANKKDDSIKKTALEIIESSKYCALISTGLDGYPNARMMDPFPPDEKMVVWMGTNSNSRKVKDIRKNNKISLYYEAPDGDGYVNLQGIGHIVDEKEEKLKYFKKGWEEYYPGNRDGFILIRFITDRIEIVSYKHGLLGDKITWEAPSLIFNNKK